METHIFVQIVDKRDQIILEAPISVEILNSDGTPISTSISETPEGKKVVYTASTAGKITVHVKAEDQPISKSPFEIQVENTVDFSRTYAKGKGYIFEK